MVPNSLALRTLSAGDVIADINSLFHSLFPEFKGIHCDLCLTKSKSLKKCANCLKMYYCGKDCQRKDWKYHKNECKVFQHKNFKLDQFSFKEIFFIRFWLTIKSDPNFVTKKYQLFDGTELSLKEMEVNLKESSQHSDYLTEFGLICYHFENFGLKFESKELFYWFSLIRMNPVTLVFEWWPTASSPFELGQSSPENLGIAFFPELYSVGHSCVPNSAIVLNGLSLQLKAMRPISVGTPLTRAFIDLDQNKSDRQKQLKSFYSINGCDCLKCDQNLDSNIFYNKFKAFFQYLLSKSGMASNLENTYANVNWHEMQELKEEILLMAKQIYGEFHPQWYEKVMLWLTASMFVQQTEDPSLEIDPQLYEELKRLFPVTHGDKHPAHYHYDLMMICHNPESHDSEVANIMEFLKI